MPQGPSVGDNLRWSFGWTLAGATTFSLYVLLVALVRGSVHFERQGVTVWQIIAGYYAAALVSGLALGLLRPLTDSRLGSYILGAVVGFCVYGAIGVGMYGPTAEVAGVAGVLALGTGGLGVVYYDGGPSFSASMPRAKLVAYGIALLAALVLLWLDVHYHIINK